MAFFVRLRLNQLQKKVLATWSAVSFGVGSDLFTGGIRQFYYYESRPSHLKKSAWGFAISSPITPFNPSQIV